jgi:hypothetical protein
MGPQTILVCAHGEVSNFRVRQRLSDDIDAALEKLYRNAVETLGEERAALHLAHLLAKAIPGNDGGYHPAPWAVEALSEHRAAIAEHFASRGPASAPPKVEGVSKTYSTKERNARATSAARAARSGHEQRRHRATDPGT